MNLEEVNKRLAEIDIEVRESEDVEEIKARTAEKIELLARKAELEDLETRKKEALEIQTGEIVGKTIETTSQEARKMTVEEIRASAEYRSAFYKSLQGKELTETEQRAYTSASATSGSAIPEASQDLLFTKMVKKAPMLSEITLLRVAGNVTFSTEGARTAAVQHTENAAITAATDTLVKVSLTGYEYNKLIYISKAVATMSINAFEGWLLDMIADDIATAIEDAIINGSGSSAPKGVAYAATWSTTTNLVVVTGTATIAYTDILNAVAMLPARYDSNAKFLVSKAMAYRGLAGIVDTAKRPILINDVADGYSFKALGYPVIVSDKVPEKTLFFGDYKKIVGNLAQDITVERDASAGFASNSIAYRGGAIFDCTVALEDSIVKLTTNTY